MQVVNLLTATAAVSGTTGTFLNTITASAYVGNGSLLTGIPIGTTWREGVGVPTSTTGTNVGDLYLDTTPATSSAPLYLAADADVAISSPISGQILKYNGTQWANAAASSSGIAAYTNTGAAVASTYHIVSGEFTNVSGNTYTLNFTGSAVFATSTYACSIIDVTQQPASTISISAQSTTSVTFLGTYGTNTYSYICIGA